MEELRKEKQDQEMAECTFRPELVTRGSKKVNIANMAVAAESSTQIQKLKRTPILI